MSFCLDARLKRGSNVTLPVQDLLSPLGGMIPLDHRSAITGMVEAHLERGVMGAAILACSAPHLVRQHFHRL